MDVEGSVLSQDVSSSPTIPTEKRSTALSTILHFCSGFFTLEHGSRALNQSQAPNNDLSFLKKLKNGITTQPMKAICSAAAKKFLGHLWYLGQHLICMSLFDDNVTIKCKRRIVSSSNEIHSRALSSFKDVKNKPNNRRKTTLHPTDWETLEDIDLDFFVSKSSMAFFEIMGIDTAFLDCDPSEWNSRDDYKSARHSVSCLYVVNDLAERAVSSIKEYNLLITKNEINKQCMIQGVRLSRQMAPKCTKKMLKKSIASFICKNKK